MRQLAAAFVFFGVCSSAAAEPAPAPAPTGAPTPALTPFVVPQPAFRGDGARALELMQLERWADARAALTAFAASADAPKAADEKAGLAYVSALCDQHLGRWADAAAGFDATATGLPLLGDYARYHAADAYTHLKKPDEAKQRLSGIAEDAVLYAESRLLLGDILRDAEKWDEVAKLYHAYLERWPNGIRVAEAKFFTAEAEEKLGHAAAAVELYRRIGFEHPLSGFADRARARLDALAPTARARPLTPAELETRAKVYFDAMRNELAEADFKAVLAQKPLEPSLRCEATYDLAQTVFKERQRPRAAPLFDDAVAACAATAKSGQGDLYVRAMYQGARSWGAAGQQKKAIALFQDAEQHTEHSFADDAALREAEQWIVLEDAGDKEAGARAEAILAAIPTRFPDGDVKAEALWRLAWRAWRAHRYADVLTWLDKEIAAVPHEENYFAEGQTHYWKARALDKLGRADEARASYERAVREYPLSYYSLLALNRLRESAPDEYAKLRAELRGPATAAAAAPTDWQVAPRAVYGEPAYQRAVWLLRLGQGEAAERELARAGLRVPEGRKKATDPDQVEKLWATALLYDRAQRYDKSHWIARWSVLDYKESWPNAGNQAKWAIAYPRGYWHIVKPAAEAQGYPPELLMAFVREESAFDPIMESFANAIGLTQMILPTAKRFGKDLGYEISRETLRDPEKNVAVGSRWLAFLWRTYHQDLGLVVAGYNAGEGAVWRWLCERGKWDYDEFGEAIPYDETRNYTKRVLSSYFAYAYLADGTIPVLPNAIPAEALNAKRCSAPAEAPSQSAARPAPAPAVKTRKARAGDAHRKHT
jgi:soluble lytic murein transglycosylase